MTILRRAITIRTKPRQHAYSGYNEACALDELAQLLLSLDLQEALAQLNEQQRRILLLLFIDDLKPAEAARRLHCTVRNITKHRLKALDRLRELL
ncbi:MAG: hypothetical protein LIO50_07405 [Phascolarctobacterium sp.]|uniref:sigma factor-like helix-turn-helix DNA-binding protein n=1 Tax=Phascolarctobacterium sp. TaxID=2049039 RepID=UPI0025DFDEB5|nr:sigma factor-like helix-turn-helix DNA-binding protein [Phascolarctobacterium sp.]MCC8159026.1 hypothetical protein [Phascolarctobacterium sp.]